MCSTFCVPGEVTVACYSDLSPDTGAIGYRVPKESFVRALVRSVLLNSCVANPAILHDWAIVGAPTVPWAFLLQMKVPAERESPGRGLSPCRWPFSVFTLPSSHGALGLAFSPLGLPLVLLGGPGWRFPLHLGWPDRRGRLSFYPFLSLNGFVDLSGPEKGVPADCVHDLLQCLASIDQVVDLPPCVAFCPEQCCF